MTNIATLETGTDDQLTINCRKEARVEVIAVLHQDRGTHKRIAGYSARDVTSRQLPDSNLHAVVRTRATENKRAPLVRAEVRSVGEDI